MDSRPTGSDVLVYIETEKAQVTIKGRTPESWMIKDEAAEFRLYSVDTPQMVVLSGVEMATEKRIYRVHPAFYEQNRYEILVECSEGHRVSVRHVNLSIRSSITAVGRHKNMVSGIINFSNDIGDSEFIIDLDEHEYLRFTMEVFPEKISYQEDYKAIVQDVTTELYSLIFDFLKTTYQGFNQGDVRSSSPVEFFAIISRVYGRFLKSIDKIIQEPHHVLHSESQVVPAFQAKRSNNASIRWLNRHPDYVIKGEKGWRMDKILTVRKHVSCDTRENRLTRFMIWSVVQRLKDFRKRYVKLWRNNDPLILDRIDSMINQLNQRINGSFLKEVTASGESVGLSLVFMMAPGYRDLYKNYIMMERGLNLTSDIFRLSVKDLAVLYEYWCFIKLNSLLKRRYELVSQDVIRTEGNKLFTTLVKGGRSQVRYRNPANGERIVLSYNSSASGLPTVPQKPDNVLSLIKNNIDGTDVTCKYIFDAKYKLDPAVPSSYYYNCVSQIPGPKEEDINTMHRYRDAIVSEGRQDFFERTMFGAYVLFPYSDEEKYRNHKFYKSIDKVNIGGLPFLPSATSLVEQKLDELVAASPETAAEQSPLPVGMERKLSKVDWGKRDVLVGVLKNYGQFSICKECKFYHIPAARISENNLPIHYVAIYQSRRIFGKESGIYLYGEVTKCSLVRRRDIREIPKNSDELYYRFDIREWKRLKSPIMVRESATVALFTNYFLLSHSAEVPELKIQSEHEFRLYYELKRLAGKSLQGDPDRPICYRNGPWLLDYEDDKVRVIRDRKICYILSAERFVKHPYECFTKIRQLMSE